MSSVQTNEKQEAYGRHDININPALELNPDKFLTKMFEETIEFC